MMIPVSSPFTLLDAASAFRDSALWAGGWLLGVIALISVFGLFAIWLERKVSAHMQSRLGPMRVGPKGLLQTLADGLKLIGKEDIIPKAADPLLFVMAPCFVFASALAMFAALPFTSYEGRKSVALTEFQAGELPWNWGNKDGHVEFYREVLDKNDGMIEQVLRLHANDKSGVPADRYLQTLNGLRTLNAALDGDAQATELYLSGRNQLERRKALAALENGRKVREALKDADLNEKAVLEGFVNAEHALVWWYAKGSRQTGDGGRETGVESSGTGFLAGEGRAKDSGNLAGRVLDSRLRGNDSGAGQSIDPSATMPQLLGAIRIDNAWVDRPWIGTAAMLDCSVLFLLAIASISVVGVVLAGWGSCNKWSLYGAMREAAQMVSYEIPLGLAALCAVVAAGSLNIGVIAQSQETGAMFGLAAESHMGLLSWNIFKYPLTMIPAFVVFYIGVLAHSKRAPFDLPEAESELVAGFMTEYTGLRWSMFFLAEYAEMYALSALAALLFLGGFSLVPGLDLWMKEAGPGVWMVYGLCVLALKTLLLVFVMMWLRWTLPRLRLDQVMYLCLKVLLPISMLALVGQAIWTLYFKG